MHLLFCLDSGGLIIYPLNKKGAMQQLHHLEIYLVLKIFYWFETVELHHLEDQQMIV